MLEHVKLSQTSKFSKFFFITGIFTSYIANLWSSHQRQCHTSLFWNFHFTCRLDWPRESWKSNLNSAPPRFNPSASSNLRSDLFWNKKRWRALIAGVQLLEIVPLCPDLPQFGHHLSSWLTPLTPLTLLSASGSLFTTWHCACSLGPEISLLYLSALSEEAILLSALTH